MASQTESAVRVGEADPAAAQDAGESTGSGIERRRHPRVVFEGNATPPEPTAVIEPDRRQTDRRQGDRRQGERRQGERRGVEGLRSDVQWTIAPNRRRGGRRRLGLRLKTSRILVLLVAVVAGSLAAYIALRQSQPAPPPAAPAPAETTNQAPPVPVAKVLVAGDKIGVGQRLSASMLEWRDWPQDGVQSDFVTQAKKPDAMKDLSGSVARSEFLPGDPIRKEKLAESADGFLSAILDGGMRGVSVPITADSASGGFISPNDHVDVVLTRQPSGGVGGSAMRSEIILHDVRVLAIDTRVGGAGTDGSQNGNGDQLQADAFSGKAIATLALDPTAAQVIVNAAALGKLSLLLRSAGDTAAGNAKAHDGANQAIRLSSPFWTQ